MAVKTYRWDANKRPGDRTRKIEITDANGVRRLIQRASNQTIDLDDADPMVAILQGLFVFPVDASVSPPAAPPVVHDVKVVGNPFEGARLAYHNGQWEPVATTGGGGG